MKVPCVAFLVFVVVSSGPAVGADFEWIGLGGNDFWTNPGNWNNLGTGDPFVVPRANDRAIFSVDTTVDGSGLGAIARRIDIAAAATLTLANGDVIVHDTISNQGNLTFQNSTSFISLGGDVSLTGGGEVQLVGTSSNFRGAGSLTNVDNTIVGTGGINFILANQGAVRAEGGTLSVINTEIDSSEATTIIETFLPVDPRSTYLRTADEQPGIQDSVAVELLNLLGSGAAAVQSGDTIFLQRVGEFEFNLGGPFQGDTLNNLWAVFSESNVLVDDPDRLQGSGRITAAVPTSRLGVLGNDAVTASGVQGINTVADPFVVAGDDDGLQPTDIPQDFVISAEGFNDEPGQGTPVEVTVPANASHIFFSAGDVQWFDNGPVSGGPEFGVIVSKQVTSTGRVEIASDGTLELFNGTLTGGTLHGEDGGLLQANASNAGSPVSLQDLTVTGKVTLREDSIANLGGVIENRGTLTFQPDEGGNATTWNIPEAATLTGGGQVEFNGSLTRIDGNGVLTNLDNTIIGNGFLRARTINHAHIRATSGTLSVVNTAVTNTDTGRVEIASDGTLELFNGTLTGGTLHGEDGGLLQANASNAGSPVSLQDLTVTGKVTLREDSIANLGGVIENRGTLTFQPDEGGNATTWNIPEAATLTGGGQVEFNGSLTRIDGNGVLTNLDNTIIGNGFLRARTINHAHIRATSGTLSVVNTAVTNTDTGRVEIASDGTLELFNGTLTGGTLHGEDGGLLQANASNAGSPVSLQDLTVTGKVTLREDSIANLGGVIENRGTLTFQPDEGGNATTWNIPEAATLTGGGQVEFNGSLTRIDGNGVLTNLDNTIIGNGFLRARTINHAHIRATSGTLSVVNTAVTNTDTGRVEIASDGTLELFNGTLTGGTLHGEEGSLLRAGAAVGRLADLTTTGDVVLDQGSLIQLHGRINNQGTLSVDSGGILGRLVILKVATLVGGGQIELGDGGIPLDGNGTLTNVDNTVVGSGLIRVSIHNQGAIIGTSPTEAVNFIQPISGSGSLENVVVNNSHTLGDPLGVVSLAGEYTLGPFAELKIDLLDLTPGSGHDQLDSTGNVNLAGSLTVTAEVLGSGYLAEVGDRFTVIQSTSPINGTFTAVQLPGAVGQRLVTWQPVDYSVEGEVSLEIASVGALAADFDGSGTVDADDFADWTANHGLTSGATHAQGDANADGAVNGYDYLVWQRQFGNSLTLGVATVPEPGSIGLGLLSLLFVSSRRLRY